jgi:hypothetical protein
VTRIANRGEGWYSASSSSDVTDTINKSTVYVRATADEIVVMQGGDRDKRGAMVQSKLLERQQLQV